jgi:hypothetical protein
LQDSQNSQDSHWTLHDPAALIRTRIAVVLVFSHRMGMWFVTKFYKSDKFDDFDNFDSLQTTVLRDGECSRGQNG